MNLLFSSENVNILLQTNGKRDRRPNFFPLFFFFCLFCFLVWNALIFGGVW